jgi:hypothetical protein
VDAHPLHCGADLLVIAHIGANAQRGASGVLDLQVAQVQFCLASRQQSHSGAALGESDGQAFPDSAPRPGYQNRNRLK